ncbi:caspase family protein [Candidatus Marithrix sp. Canyon 246]|uniref:caspase family protein n=1 Tax=Candidatus Marithrix sp. Canyon 246 TaxID=1827136 RepID=UPI00084A15C2|nr:caspase family protein [Candidatus Marithrix sp. Canyon 246]
MKKYLLVLILVFLSNNISASALNCWKNHTKKPTSFVLAMGANTKGLKMSNFDAVSFAKGIQKRFRIPSSNICVLKNVKRWEFEYVLQRLAKLVHQQDQVFIYFSGHGTKLVDHSGDEKDCYDEAFVTVHYSGKGMEFLSDDAFVYLVNKIKTNKILTVIDTCFASGLLRGACQHTKSKFWSNKQKHKKCRTRRTFQPTLKGILYPAAKEDQAAWELRDGGLFTSIFIKNMKKYPSFSLKNIYRMTKKEVTAFIYKYRCKNTF